MTHKQKYSGQSLVEFALIFPMVVFAMTVFFDLGRGIYYFSAISNSVREGTRYAIVHPMGTTAERDEIINTVKHYAVGINTDSLTVTLTPPCCGGDLVTIAASYPFQPVTPGLALILGAGHGITVHAQSTMEVAPINR